MVRNHKHTFNILLLAFNTDHTAVDKACNDTLCEPSYCVCKGNGNIDSTLKYITVGYHGHILSFESQGRYYEVITNTKFLNTHPFFISFHLKFSKHGEASNKIFFKLTFYTYSCYKYHLVSHIYLYITNAMQKKHYMFPLKVCTATTRKTRTLAKNTVIIFKLNVVVTYSNVSKRCRWSWKQCSPDLQEQSDLEGAV